MRLLTSTRTAMAQAIITAIGNGATIKNYNGTMPTDLGAPEGTLLSTGTWTGVPIGTASAGGIDIDEAGITQSNGSHVNGTPTFSRVSTSGGAAIIDIGIGAGADEWDFAGTVATGQNVTYTGLTIPVAAANATA